ncbi:MAG: hypothetical protein ACXW3Z_02940 [Limisphaerales bacterium]
MSGTLQVVFRAAVAMMIQEKYATLHTVIPGHPESLANAGSAQSSPSVVIRMLGSEVSSAQAERFRGRDGVEKRDGATLFQIAVIVVRQFSDLSAFWRGERPMG